ncbi:hypothetical protein HUJ04_008776 [Dendroctonus ponderosae]|uniref:BACK domain-containing protein n=3 Tax=Dendroctonus ponderosae TaxID=77166 RepID=A0AAR5Q5G5_DENPD|nr:hypothetical protein HUJ04_008776 [Dendroctonus ponderosae]
MEVISSFVSLLVESPDESRKEVILKIPLECANPSHLSAKMVQVAHDPQQENGPLIARTNTENIPDDLKRNMVPSVTDDAYKVVTSSMMADQTRQVNPVTALSLLESALINRNVPIAKHYISDLTDLIKKDNALTILNSISKWIHSSEADRQLNFEPSAPPLVDNAAERNDSWMEEPLGELRDKILQKIQKNGDFYLRHSEFPKLHYQDVFDITTSDDLQVSNELVVYCAIMCWAEAECQRTGLSTEDVNIKAVLKDLIYAPRYGLMSKKEFSARTIEHHKGPDRIGIQSEVNEEIIRFISNKKRINRALPHKLSKARSKSDGEVMKEKVIINCLTCFTAVFD